jgi:hypothetical protein
MWQSIETFFSTIVAKARSSIVLNPQHYEDTPWQLFLTFVDSFLSMFGSEKIIKKEQEK